MPTSVIAAGATGLIAGSTLTVAGGLTLGFSMSAFAGSLVLGAASRALSKPPAQAGGGIGSVQSQARNLSVKQAIPPRQVIAGTARVGGAITFMHVYQGIILNMVITLAGHQCSEISEIRFDDEVVPLDADGLAIGKYGNATVVIRKSLGDEGTAQPFPGLVLESDGKWTNDHLQMGCTKIWVRLSANPTLFPNGIPNISAIVDGALVYDNRDATTGFSANAALWTAHYLNNDVYGLGASYADEIDDDDLTAAANACEEAVALAAGGTEERYQVNGAFLMSERPKDVLQRLLAAMAGKAVNTGDSWRLIAGIWYAPTVTLDETYLRGPVSTQVGTSGRESATGVKGVFTDPNAGWQPTDFPAIESSTYITEDGGESQWKDVDFSAFVTSATQAQRLAKIELLRIRQNLTHTAPMKLSAWGIVPGKNVSITDTQMGWSGKAFEVLESTLVIEEGENGAPILGVDHALRETAAAIYDWSTSEEGAYDIAPNTDLPDVGVIGTPGVPVVTEELYETRDGRGVAARALVSAGESSYPFGALYQLEYSVASAGAYVVLPVTRVPEWQIDDMAPGRYDFRVKAIGVTGAESNYALADNKEILGLGAPPAVPTGVSLQIAGGTARIKLDRPTELDVLRGGRILVRFCHDGVTVSWETAFSIGEIESWPGDSTQIDLPLKPGTYLVKARDSTGQESTTWAEIYTKQASVLAFSDILTIQEDSAFGGTHSGTAADSGTLTLGGVGMFDDIPDFDAVTDLDGYGGIAAQGTYTFSTATDLGTVSRVRLTSRIEGSVDNVLDLVDDRTGNIDDWLDFDGTAFGGSSADVWVELRETDDDPAGSPTWSDWKRVDASEHEARGFQYRAQLVAYDPAYRPLVTALRVTIAEVV